MKPTVRAKRTRLLPRLCVCGVGLVTATWLVHFLHVTAASPRPRARVEGTFFWSKRELLQDSNTSSTSRAAIHEFPEDVFTVEQRRQGAVLLHVLCAVLHVHALAIVCDVYFVPSLEKISENLQLSEDVAGATFMAAGSSAPELFTSLIGVFITKGDLGVGTIVGSAVFNILIIIGVCGMFAGQPISLSWWPLFRDASFYILSVLVLILVIYDDKVIWWETIILISMYGVYILIMRFNRPLCNWVESRCHRGGQPCLSTLRRTTAVGHGDCDNDLVPLKTDPCALASQDPSGGGVAMTDELLTRHPHRLSFSEASLRLLITTPPPPPPSRPSEEEEEEEPEEEEEELAFRPFVMPEGCWRLTKWLVAWPVSVLLHITVPNCALPRWHRWYLVTFLCSTLWIALFSYLMVWMVTIISFTLGIPEVIMGITFLAAGTSVPDCMASLIVARQGMGDMAVSNSIGSNIFDILLGLGFPWALRTLMVDYGSVVYINSKGLVYSVILLLASVILTVLSVHLNRWKLDRRLGLCLMLLYAIFLLCSIGFEQI
ncbi:sodium/potassium/calcium exchanger 3-like [Aplochiton taeniatus]